LFGSPNIYLFWERMSVVRAAGRGLAAVNETPYAARQSRETALLLHALFGMDRYNGRQYLDKLSVPELERLQAALAGRQRLVDEALRDALSAPPASSCNPLHLTDWFVPDVQTALSARSSRTALSRLLSEEAPGVYAFDLLTPEACARLIDAAEQWASRALAADRHDGPPFRHAPLDRLGPEFAALGDALLRSVVAPLAELLFPTLARALDWRYTYVIGYAPSAVDPMTPRDSLTPHTDDAEVTLNVSLGQWFEGGELVLRGLRGAPKENEDVVALAPVAGRGVLHLGQQLHAVTPVTAGRRFALILWARSSAYRARACPCCVVHRRDGQCVLDDSWR
jgi:hypothetical protein